MKDNPIEGEAPPRAPAHNFDGGFEPLLLLLLPLLLLFLCSRICMSAIDGAPLPPSSPTTSLLRCAIAFVSASMAAEANALITADRLSPCGCSINVVSIKPLGPTTVIAVNGCSTPGLKGVHTMHGGSGKSRDGTREVLLDRTSADFNPSNNV